MAKWASTDAVWARVAGPSAATRRFPSPVGPSPNSQVTCVGMAPDGRTRRERATAPRPVRGR
jgi:hypothetical protein